MVDRGINNVFESRYIRLEDRISSMVLLYYWFRRWRIYYPDRSRMDFEGLLSLLSSDSSMENAIEASCELKISGKITFYD